MTWNQLMQNHKLEGINFDKLFLVGISTSLIGAQCKKGEIHECTPFGPWCANSHKYIMHVNQLQMFS